jgi:hypothetical protein
MLFVDMKINNKKIGSIEIVNIGESRGKTSYEVTYRMPYGIVIEFKVRHKRSDGAVKLMKIVTSKLDKVVDEFFSIPEDKVEDGAIRCKDIPERYSKAFSKYSPVNTGIQLGGDMALWVSDVKGFLDMMKKGTVPMWD